MTGTTETVTHEKNTVTTKQWWSSLMNLQTVVIIFGGFASLVLFWNTQKNHSNSIDAINKTIPLKAEQSDLKAIDDKVNRQYDQIRTVLDRIIVVEKGLEYQRGRQDAVKEIEKANNKN